MPSSRKKHSRPSEESRDERNSAAAVRSFWSGTITFGLVSIPVDLLSAVRPRQTAMKLVDKEGHALGRQYHCSKDGKKLNNDDLVRGYEMDGGKMVQITDDEFESVAPEMSSDIELRNFVPAEQIPPVYFQKPYFLAPSGKSARAYNLLAATMERTGRVGIGSFVMRGHEYLVAIVPDNGVLRADTLRYADEIRSPESIGLPKHAKASAKKVDAFAKEIDELTRKELSFAELEDQDAEALQKLVRAKEKDPDSVIHHTALEDDDYDEDEESGGNVIDFTEVLRRSLSKRAVVTHAGSSAPISLDERRALKKGAAAKPPPKKKSAARKSRKRASR